MIQVKLGASNLELSPKKIDVNLEGLQVHLLNFLKMNRKGG
jgi:hypothetical protein